MLGGFGPLVPQLQGGINRGDWPVHPGRHTGQLIHNPLVQPGLAIRQDVGDPEVRYDYAQGNAVIAVVTEEQLVALTAHLRLNPCTFKHCSHSYDAHTQGCAGLVR